MRMLNNVDIDAHEASALIIVTQHYDTLNAVGANNRSNMILLPNSPTAATGMLSELVTALTAAEQMKNVPRKDERENLRS